jgi:hypothetical protein
MPYSNLPKSQWGAMDACVDKVMAQGHDKPSAIAICYTSISKESGEDDMSRQDRARAKQNRAKRETATLKDLADLQSAVGDSMEAQPIAAETAPEPLVKVYEGGFTPAELQAAIQRESVKVAPAPLTLYKQADGATRFAVWATNNRRDKDRPAQILTEKAHKDFLAYLDANPDKAPELWHWHTPGTRYGKADTWDYCDGFMLYSGLIDEGKEKEAEFGPDETIGVSHGFYQLAHDATLEHIDGYRTFEVSDLPLSRAANPYTSYSVIRKEASMNLSPEKRAYLVKRMGEQRVAELEQNGDALKQAADALGIEQKELPETPVAEVPAAPVAEAPAAEVPAPAETAPDELETRIGKLIDAKLAGLGKSLETTQAAVLSVAESVKAADAKATAAYEAAKVADSVAKDARTSLDDQVASLISPRSTPGGRGYRPTQDKATAVANKATAPAKADTREEPHLPQAPNEWWLKEVIEPLQKAG